jgi:putative DNA primase/helicase
MSADIRARLEDRGICLQHYQPGEQRAPCPKCRRGKRDNALAVKIDDRGATWLCHRAGCNWSGAAREGYRTERPQRRDAAFDATMERLRDATPQPTRPRPVTGPLAIWAKAGPIWGTHAETYLRRRNLIPADADRTATYPWEHLRFHPSCLMKGYGRHPALIVAINDPTGLLVAVQRIAVTADGLNAAIPDPKLSLGPIKGNAARLAGWR